MAYENIRILIKKDSVNLLEVKGEGGGYQKYPGINSVKLILCSHLMFHRVLSR